jgi:kynureninase
VQALGVDMICGGSVKWLCGGPGAAYLYTRPGLLEELEPSITGWMAHANPFDFATGEQEYAEGPWRMLHGSPAVASLLAATAGHETILEVGTDVIRDYSIRMTERLRENLLDRGFRIPSPADPARRGGTLTVGVNEDEDAAAFVTALAQRGILVDQRPGSGIRVSPHFYTRVSELDEFAEAISELRASGSWKDHVNSTAVY